MGAAGSSFKVTWGHILLVWLPWPVLGAVLATLRQHGIHAAWSTGDIVALAAVAVALQLVLLRVHTSPSLRAYGQRLRGGHVLLALALLTLLLAPHISACAALLAFAPSLTSLLTSAITVVSLSVVLALWLVATRPHALWKHCFLLHNQREAHTRPFRQIAAAFMRQHSLTSHAPLHAASAALITIR